MGIAAPGVTSMLIGALLGLASAAHAEPFAQAVPAPAAGHATGPLTVTATFATDYRVDGLSLSSRQPVAQMSASLRRPHGAYLGLWVSGVDFSTFGDSTTSIETAIQAGINHDAGGVSFDRGGKRRLNAELMYFVYPDRDLPGPTSDFIQLRLRAAERRGSWVLRGETTFVPQAPGQGGRAFKWQGVLERRFAPGVVGSATLGSRFVQRGADRSYWDIGVAVTRPPGVLELRYYDTDLTFRECGRTRNCGSALVARLRLIETFP